MRPITTVEHRWSLALLALATVALFLLLHPYAGLVHDARLYTLQALNHLHPEVYGNDVFVRFGSQDDYTLFSPLYAFAISWLGVEQAAVTLTLVATCLFLTATWTLARTLLPTRQACATLLLLVVIPAYYGPARIFAFLEGFVTPRQLAEALTLFSLAAWFRDMRVLAIVLAVCAMLIHPIIGSVGIVFLVVLTCVMPRWRRFWPAAALAALFCALALAGWLPISYWQFDSEWYEIVMRRMYLGLRHWDSGDWARVATVMATLAAGGFVLQGRLRAVAVAAFFSTAALLLVALIGGDLLRIVIVVQAQTWRVLWLATVLAIVLMPAMYVTGWRASALARCALLLLAAAWTAPSAAPALIASLLATIAVTFSSRAIAPTSGLLLVGGAWAVLVLAVGSNLATALLSWGDGLTRVTALPPMLDELLTVGQSGVLPFLVTLAGAYVFLRFKSPVTNAALTFLAIVAVVALAITAVPTWVNSQYEQALRDSFAVWREHIPPGHDVMWTSEDSPWGDGATNTWLLLERPAFLSGTQSPNALFSRPAAIEMQARAQSLWGLLPFVHPFRPKSDRQSTPPYPLRLERVCDASAVRFVVTSAAVMDATPIPAPASAPSHLRDYKLYICT